MLTSSSSSKSMLRDTTIIKIAMHRVAHSANVIINETPAAEN